MTQTTQSIPGLLLPKEGQKGTPEVVQQASTEDMSTQASGLFERQKLEDARAGAWLRRRDPYAA